MKNQQNFGDQMYTQRKMNKLRYIYYWIRENIKESKKKKRRIKRKAGRKERGDGETERNKRKPTKICIYQCRKRK